MSFEGRAASAHIFGLHDVKMMMEQAGGKIGRTAVALVLLEARLHRGS